MKLATVIVILASALSSTACSDTPNQPDSQPQTASFGGTLAPGGFVSYPFNAERSGTTTATLTTSAPLDIVFIISLSPSPPCVRNNCVPVVRPNESKQLTYSTSKGQVIYLVAWHVLDVGEARGYSIDVNLK
jgi:hypothetical protein